MLALEQDQFFIVTVAQIGDRLFEFVILLDLLDRLVELQKRLAEPLDLVLGQVARIEPAQCLCLERLLDHLHEEVRPALDVLIGVKWVVEYGVA